MHFWLVLTPKIVIQISVTCKFEQSSPIWNKWARVKFQSLIMRVLNNIQSNISNELLFISCLSPNAPPTCNQACHFETNQVTYVKRKPKRVKNTLLSKNSKFSSQVNRSFCISWSRDQLSINRKTFRFWNGEGRRSKQRNEFAEWHVAWLEFPADSKLN